jgi:hypothetical protein
MAVKPIQPKSPKVSTKIVVDNPVKQYETVKKGAIKK